MFLIRDWEIKEYFKNYSYKDLSPQLTLNKKLANQDVTNTQTHIKL